MRFPPILNRRHFERSGYLDVVSAPGGNGPQLRGYASGRTASCFEPSHRGGDWSARFPAADVVLTPAACYPVYPTARGTAAGVRPAGRRHVVLLPPRAVRRCRTDADVPHARARAGRRSRDGRWRGVRRGGRGASQVVDALRLDARADVASDPFFGRGGEAPGREPARSAAQARDRGARSPATTAADRDHLAQLPSGSLRRALRHHDRRRRGRAHGVRRVRSGAD